MSFPTPEEHTFFSQPESARFDRKSGISMDYKEQYSKLICGFSNNLENANDPAYLVIGLNDDNGTLSGKQFTDEQERQVVELRNTGYILPIPRLEVKRKIFSEGDVLIVCVYPSDNPPVRYKRKTWVRIGSTTREASAQEERTLFSRSSGISQDVKGCVGASVDDLSLDLFQSYRRQALDPDVIEANGRDLPEQLAALRFLDFRSQLPTYAAVVLFGKNPRYFLPGYYVQFVTFSGDSLANDVIEQQEISGDLLSIVKTLEQMVAARNTASLRTQSTFSEASQKPYPDRAIREILMNALIHRDLESNAPVRFYWFANALEIQNPGGLYGQVTQENYDRTNDYRNPVLADAAKVYGYVNKFGYGIAQARKLLAQNGNPEPFFEFTPHFVRVRIDKAAQSG
jgi:ATP-dependent DNA helicase RecG